MAIIGWQPRDGWRAFAGEVGVIVLGVLIALVAQQAAEEWQWRQTVQRAKDDLNQQIRFDIVNIAERAAVNRCLTGRLSELAERVAANRGEWKADPYRAASLGPLRGVNSYVVPPAYRIPVRNLPVDVWEQTKSGGTLSHMTRADIGLYSLIFDDIIDLKASNNAERELAASLSYLSYDGMPSPQERARALSTIAQLDYHNTNIIGTTENVIGYVGRLRTTFTDADLRQLREFLDRQQRFRGTCVDPAATWKLVAPLMPKAGASR